LWMLAVIHHTHDHMTQLISEEEFEPETLMSVSVVAELARMRFWDPATCEELARALMQRVTEEVGA